MKTGYILKTKRISFATHEEEVHYVNCDFAKPKNSVLTTIDNATIFEYPKTMSNEPIFDYLKKEIENKFKRYVEFVPIMSEVTEMTGEEYSAYSRKTLIEIIEKQEHALEQYIKEKAGIKDE